MKTTNADISAALGFARLISQAEPGDKYDALSPEAQMRLQNPPTTPVDDLVQNERFSLKMYYDLHKCPQDAYKNVQKNIHEQFPDFNMDSFDQVVGRIAQITGVYPIYQDMCFFSCVAFVGIWAELTGCPKCGAPRYKICQNKKGENIRTPRKQFCTIPIAPLLQANYRSPEGAESMDYFKKTMPSKLREYLAADTKLDNLDDLLDGTELIELIQSEEISLDDMILVLSIDGAQLYRNKQSDFWVYVWIIVNKSPNERYKKRHVLPGAIIPGPNKPKDIDSFMFTGLHHLASIQKNGIKIWNAYTNIIFTSRPFLYLTLADGPGMAFLHGMVGHHGRKACRLYCGLPGRRKPNASHYYPALNAPRRISNSETQPSNIIIPPTHSDVLASNLPYPSRIEYIKGLKNLIKSSSHRREYEKTRLETGISKPSIFQALPRALPLPSLFALDIMHVVLNLAELMINLLRGKFECDQQLGDS
jgi:hypothetical protein